MSILKKVSAVFFSLLLIFGLSGCINLSHNMTMAEYVEEMKPVFDKICANESNENCTLEISARGNSLVHTAKLTFVVEAAEIEGLKVSLSQSLEEGKEDYYDMLETARKSVPNAYSIIVEYIDSTEKMIYSREFK